MKKLGTVLVFLLLAVSSVSALNINVDCGWGNSMCKENDLEQEFDLVEDAVNDLEDDVEDLFNLIDDLECEEGEDCCDEIDDLDSRISQNEDDIEDLESYVSALESSISHLENKDHILFHKIHELKNKVNWLQWQIYSLRYRVHQLENRMDDVEDDVEDLEDDLEDTQEELEETQQQIVVREADWSKDAEGMSFAKYWKVLLTHLNPWSDREALSQGRDILAEYGSVEEYLYQMFYNRLMEDITNGKWEADMTEYLAEQEQSTTTTTLPEPEATPTVEELDCEEGQFVRAIYQDGERIGWQCYEQKQQDGPIKLN